MNLPVSLDHQGRIGIRFEYHLTHDDERLERARTLTDQGVRRNSVLWIETETKLLAATDPQQGTLSTAVFRGTETSDVLQWARKQLLSRIGQAGLGVRGLPR